jgi:Methylamine utilisation protein MauE
VTSSVRDLLASGVVASALVLLIAGGAKVRDRHTFGSQIASYDVVPAFASRVLGQVLPFAEVAAAIALLVVPHIAGVAAALLFATFAAAVGVNLLRGRTELVCGCFGARGRHTISLWHVAGNGVLGAVGVAASLAAVHQSLASVVLGVSVLLIAAVVWTVHEARLPAYRLTSTKEV